MESQIEEKRVEGRQKRIASVAYTHYASDPRVRRETEILAEAGYLVDVYVLASDEPTDDCVGNGIRIVRIPLARYRGESTINYLRSYTAFLVKAGLRLTQQHRSRNYELVHVHTMPDLMVLAAMGLKLSGVPILLDVHDLMPEIFAGKFGTTKKNWKISLLYLTERFSAGLANRVVIPTTSLSRRLIANRIPAEKLVVVHNLPDPGIFGRLGSLLGQEDPNIFRISYHGTLAHRLGLRLPLEGLARHMDEMEREGPWRFDVLGDGDTRQELQRFAMDAGLRDRVHFSEGFVPVEQLPEALRGASLGIVPNLVQQDTDLMLPTKLLEYLYLGIPTLATPTATVAAYLAPDQVTFVADPDPDAWARAILDLRKDAQKRRAQAQRGLDFFRIHSWEQEAKKLLQVVEDLVES